MKIKNYHKIFLLLFTAGFFLFNYLMIFFKSTLFDKLTKLSLSLNYFFLLFTLICVLHIISNFFLVLREFKKNNWIVLTLQNHWNNYFPVKVKNNLLESQNKIYLMYTDQGQRTMNLHFDSYILIFTIIFSLIIYSFQIFYDQFYLGLFYLPFLGGLTYLSGKLNSKSFENFIQKTHESKAFLLQWIGKYLRGNIEIYSNYSHTDKLKNCINEAGSTYYKSLTRLYKLTFNRDIKSRFLIDFPFLICTGVTLYSCLQGKLSVQSTFIWLGVTEYLISSLNSFRQLLIQKQELNPLSKIVENTLEELINNRETKAQRVCMDEELIFSLRDKSKIVFTQENGVHLIRGGNGSGKSALIQSWIGHFDDYDTWNKSSIEKVRSIIIGKYRYLSSQPEFLEWVFTSNDFCALLKNSDLFLKLSKKNQKFWYEKAKKTLNRFHSNELLSSGEKFYFSFIRFIISYDQKVEFLFIDESDVFLDEQSVYYFNQTLLDLAQFLCIYRVNHGVSSIEAQIDFNVVACNKNATKGILIPMRLIARSLQNIKLNSVQWKSGGNAGHSFLPLTVKMYSILYKFYPDIKNLENYSIEINGDYLNLSIGEDKSAGLAILIALIQLSEKLKNKNYPFVEKNWSATGWVLENGELNSVFGLEVKKNASINKELDFFHSLQFNHVSNVIKKFTSRKILEEVL